MTDRPRVAVFVGTRPEAIKMAPVAAALIDEPELEPILVSTGQHREMLEATLSIFGLEPDVRLDVMTENQTLGGLTSRLATALGGVLDEIEPQAVLVQGDTTTAFMGALSAFYHQIPIGHVEAGLRTGSLTHPFPEEANRKLIGAIADLHFAPTETGKDNLLAEGVSEDRIWVTGNTVVDALQLELRRQQQPQAQADVDAKLAAQLGAYPFDRRFVLITCHRRESFGEGFREICAAIAELAETFADHEFVYPVHPNPNVDGPVRERLGGYGNVHLPRPLDYPEFVSLMGACHIVLTDSGGIQEEAPALGKPVLVARDVTERPEGVAAGTVRLVGPHRDTIVPAVTDLLRNPDSYAAMAHAANPYGDGYAAERIRKVLVERLV